MLSRVGCDRECDQSVRIKTRHRQRSQQWKRRRMEEQETARTEGAEGGHHGTWPGLRDARPKRSPEIGVEGNRAPSSLVFVKFRGRKIEGAERASSFWPGFSFFFLYHLFIVKVQELTCSASYGVNKTSVSKHSNKRKTIAFHLKVCQVLDPSPNIRLTKESKITVKAKQLFWT